MPKDVIIIKNKELKKIEVWGSLTGLCKKHLNFQYPTIKKLKFPYLHKGWEFIKIPYNKIDDTIDFKDIKSIKVRK